MVGWSSHGAGTARRVFLADCRTLHIFAPRARERPMAPLEETNLPTEHPQMTLPEHRRVWFEEPSDTPPPRVKIYDGDQIGSYLPTTLRSKERRLAREVGILDHGRRKWLAHIPHASADAPVKLKDATPHGLLMPASFALKGCRQELPRYSTLSTLPTPASFAPDRGTESRLPLSSRLAARAVLALASHRKDVRPG